MKVLGCPKQVFVNTTWRFFFKHGGKFCEWKESLLTAVKKIYWRCSRIEITLVTLFFFGISCDKFWLSFVSLSMRCKKEGACDFAHQFWRILCFSQKSMIKSLWIDATAFVFGLHPAPKHMYLYPLSNFCLEKGN